MPKDFVFSIQCTTLHGLQMLLMGRMVVCDGLLDVEPFCLMTDSELPIKKLSIELDSKWKPIYHKTRVQLIPEDVDEELVQNCYIIVVEYLE